MVVMVEVEGYCLAAPTQTQAHDAAPKPGNSSAVLQAGSDCLGMCESEKEKPRTSPQQVRSAGSIQVPSHGRAGGEANGQMASAGGREGRGARTERE